MYSVMMILNLVILNKIKMKSSGSVENFVSYFKAVCLKWATLLHWNTIPFLSANFGNNCVKLYCGSFATR